MGLIAAPGALSLLVGSESILCDQLKQKTWSLHSISPWQQVKLSNVSLGTYPCDSLVADENVKKPLKKKKKKIGNHYSFLLCYGNVWKSKYIVTRFQYIFYEV